MDNNSSTKKTMEWVTHLPNQLPEDNGNKMEINWEKQQLSTQGTLFNKMMKMIFQSSYKKKFTILLKDKSNQE